jgi:uncharacterized protein YijF (DUF1287 family)
VSLEDTKTLPSPDAARNVIGALLLGLTVFVLVVSSTRARGAEVEGAGPLAADQLTPVPMSVEPTGAPGRPPPTFVAAFGDRGPRTTLTSSEETAIVERARLELDRVTVYDGSWMDTSSYPMGDVPSSRGACTDVVVRALRAIGVDLQELVHEDMARDLQAFGVTALDTNIDHRRLSTMFTFFARNAMSLPTSLRDKASFRPGDVVFVAFQTGHDAPAEHVAVVSDKTGPRGLPLVIENGGPRPAEQDSLGRGGRIVGHFRALSKR